MVFSSIVFLLLFLPVTLCGYYLIRRELKNVFLLIMSLLFYAAGEPRFVFIMMASIVFNYLGGLLITRFRESNVIWRKMGLILAVLVNLGLLFYYKYYDFTVTNLNTILHMSLPLRNIVLPIGISFFTFQGMSYVLDVYMGKAEAQRNPLNVALYIALFPQLIAGPIVRYTDINKEIIFRRETMQDFSEGVQRFSVGLAKKVVLSNPFALLADYAFESNPSELGAAMAWLGALAYTFQIYFDFSGYSDMAIGLGKMLGFHFPENFNYPYAAQTVSEFWRRWHISLSSWFRDYVYIPLGGNRTGNVYVHLLIVFLLTGLWHGASWNFVVWGLWHGAFLIIERVLRNHKVLLPIPKALKWLYTMLAVVIGWIFFRAPNLTSAILYLKCMIGTPQVEGVNVLYTLQDYSMVFVIGIIAAIPKARLCRYFQSNLPAIPKVSKFTVPIIYGILLLIGIAYTVSCTYNPFIYFNF